MATESCGTVSILLGFAPGRGGTTIVGRVRLIRFTESGRVRWRARIDTGLSIESLDVSSWGDSPIWVALITTQPKTRIKIGMYIFFKFKRI